MSPIHNPPTSIDAYIAACPPEVRKTLEQIRATIRAAAPQASERISYQIPTFSLHGNLVHFAAFSRHIGFYPTSSGIEHFKNEFSGYETARGTVRFPLDRPIPYDLIRRIVQFRVRENLARFEVKARKTHG
jgi:uncharacterized protein YdhG (YjbR/CyaY superfamily)